MYYILPLTEDARQVFTLDMSIDGVSFHARIEIRYLPAPDCWVISVWDNSTGEMLINMIPLVCSYGEINDLFLPFGHLRGGQGIGAFSESCQPIILLRIYWCKGDEAPERKNKKHNAEREEQTMNNNMMELNMNEMELVNGGVNIFGAITGAVLGGLGGAALGGTFGSIPGAVVGGVAGAVTGAAVGGADYK